MLWDSASSELVILSRAVTRISVPLSSVLQWNVSPLNTVGHLEKMLECHFLLCVCVSVYVSVCVCVFLWSRQYSHHGDQLGILGISVPVDRMILSTAAVSKKSLRTRSNTHTHRQTQTHTHQTCDYTSYTRKHTSKYHIRAKDLYVTATDAQTLLQ